MCRDRKNLLTDGKQRSAHVSGSGIPLWEECTKTHQKVRNNILFSYQPPLVTARKGEIGPPRPGTRIGGLEALEPRNWGSGAGLARFGPISRFGRFRGPGNHEIPLTPGVPKNTFLGSSNGKFPEFGRIQQKTAKNSVFPLTPGQFWGVPPPNRAIPGSGRAILGSPAGGGEFWGLGPQNPG